MARETAQTIEQRERTEKCVKMDAALARLHTMTAGQLAAYAENEFKQTLNMENGRTWLHKKVAYMEQARVYGGLTGPAAERAAALDTPAVIAELRAEDAEIEELNKIKTLKRGGTTMSQTPEKTTAVKSTPKATTPKATTPKAATPKAATPKAEKKGRVGKYAPTDKITLLTKENPKREGSEAHKRFALYAKHNTVESFLKAGGTSPDLNFDAKHGHIKIGA